MEIEKTPTISIKKSNDDEKIIQDLISSAEKGDINSRIKLGKLYYHGSATLDYFDEQKHEKHTKVVHTEQDTDKAKEIFEQLSKENCSEIEAAFYLGRIFYDYGLVNKAIECFDKCPKHTHAAASFYLCLFLFYFLLIKNNNTVLSIEKHKYTTKQKTKLQNLKSYLGNMKMLH